MRHPTCGLLASCALWLLACGGDSKPKPEGACESYFDCAEGQDCLDGMCDSPGGSGQPCRRNGSCAPGTEPVKTMFGTFEVALVCNDDHVCVLPGARGTPCVENACDVNASAFCEAHVCVGLRNEGEPCPGHDACLADYCNTAGKCGDPSAGDPCDHDAAFECGQGRLLCLDDVCIERSTVELGGRCTDDRHCAAGMCVEEICALDPCDGVTCDDTQVCVEGTCLLAAGQPCDTTEQCASPGGCGTALDGSQRCLERQGFSCTSAPFAGGVHLDLCSEAACATKCVACWWLVEVNPDVQVAYCADDCEGFPDCTE